MPSLEEHEQDIRSKLLKVPGIARRLAYVNDIANLLKRATNCLCDVEFEKMSASHVASSLLIARMSSDYYAMHRLMQLGYGVQACVLSRGIFEMGWTASEFCVDEQRAGEWLDAVGRGSDKNTIDYVGRILSRHLTRKDVDQAAADTKAKLMQGYATLTSFAHANPRMMESHPEEEWESNGTLRIGPDGTLFGTRTICAAVDFCADACHAGLGEYIDIVVDALQPSSRNVLVSELNRLSGESAGLRREMVQELAVEDEIVADDAGACQD